MRTITRTAAAGLIVAGLALAGCGSDSDGGTASDATTTTTEATSTTAAAAELKIEDVWARKSPAGTTMGAVYLTITSPEDDKLLAAAVPTDVAKETQIHETVAAEEGDMSSTTMAEGDMSSTTMAEGDMTSTTMAGGEGDMGSMTMREVDSIDLPAGEMVELKPGGYHVMLIDLVKPLEVGDKIEVTLTFEKAGDKTVTAEVREG